MVCPESRWAFAGVERADSVLRCYGRRGLQEHVRSGVALAAQFEAWVAAERGWELCAPPAFLAGVLPPGCWRR